VIHVPAKAAFDGANRCTKKSRTTADAPSNSTPRTSRSQFLRDTACSLIVGRLRISTVRRSSRRCVLARRRASGQFQSQTPLGHRLRARRRCLKRVLNTALSSEYHTPLAIGEQPWGRAARLARDGDRRSHPLAAAWRGSCGQPGSGRLWHKPTSGIGLRQEAAIRCGSRPAR